VWVASLLLSLRSSCSSKARAGEPDPAIGLLRTIPLLARSPKLKK